MRVAIISNGPSAELFRNADRDSFDAVIGVNGRVALFRCDWWCFVDWPTFVDIEPLNHPRLFVSKFVPIKLAANAPEHMERFHAHRTTLYHQDTAMPTLPEDLPPWYSFSGTAALGLAWRLGANRVTVYGADMDGDMDHDGKVGVSRTPQRWAHERRIWGGIVHALVEHGLAVQRVLWPE